MKDFLDNPRSILVILAEKLLLTAAKLINYIQSANIDAIYLDLQYQYTFNDYFHNALEELKDEGEKILVLQSTEKNMNPAQEYELCELVLNHKRQVIIITGETGDTFQQLFPDAKKITDQKNSFKDLSEESQKAILAKTVVFQGAEVSLDKFIDPQTEHFLDSEVLLKLLKNEKIEIGKPLADSKYCKVQKYYIERTFSRQPISKNLLLEDNDFFCAGVDEKCITSHQDIVIISDDDADFQRIKSHLVKKHQERKVHWLRKQGDHFVWQESYGNVSKLRKLLDIAHTQQHTESNFIDLKEKVVIIVAEPGMGKSTVMTTLIMKTQESAPDLWIVRMNLLDYLSELETIEEGMQLLYRVGLRLFQEEGGRKMTKQYILMPLL